MCILAQLDLTLPGVGNKVALILGNGIKAVKRAAKPIPASLTYILMLLYKGSLLKKF